MARVVSTDAILGLEADVLSPCALGAILTEQTIAALNVPIVAGGANNQLATPQATASASPRAASSTRPIMSSTPAGSSTCRPNISATAMPAWCASGSRRSRAARADLGGKRAASGRDPAAVADAMAQKLIGRG